MQEYVSALFNILLSPFRSYTLILLPFAAAMTAGILFFVFRLIRGNYR